MNGRSLIMLALALVFGLGAMTLTRQMLSKESGKPVEDTQDVLVAARDIKEEESLKPDMVKVSRMAKSAIPPGAFSSPKDIEERWVKTALLEGDLLIEKKLGPKGTPPGLVANIPNGMRAFALDVTEQTGVSGFILPGHHVDVVRYDSEQGVQRGETILQNILVLASGQVFIRAEEKSLATRTVTLAVTPAQVDTLVATRAKGSLSLSLRGLNDQTVVPRPQPKTPAEDPMEKRWKLEEERRKAIERELGELKATLAKKAAEPPPPAVRMPAPRFIAIYRGSRDGANHLERVRIDGSNASELATPPEVVAKGEARDRKGPFGTPSPGLQADLDGDLQDP
ncbi:MAG: Flp pilus assembly protein CpaB [Isosphaeraceae bacterium]